MDLGLAYSMKRLLILLLLLSPVAADEISKAYGAIPHRYTPFVATQAKMSGAEKLYLKRTFALVNEAIVLKVEAMRTRDFAKYQSRTSSLLGRLNNIKPVSGMKSYQNLIREAIQDQRAYFKVWAKNPKAPFDVSNPNVGQASRKLQAAYGILNSRFPGQPPTVRNAFFDHLCALDFI